MKIPGFAAEASLYKIGECYHKSGTYCMSSENNQVIPQLSLPFYGNYCGPGHGDPTGNTPPKDAVDAVCRRHDLCYQKYGYFDCRCDRQLIVDMPSAIVKMNDPKGIAAGLAVAGYFSNPLHGPCYCHYKPCFNIPFGGGRHCLPTMTVPSYWATAPCFLENTGSGTVLGSRVSTSTVKQNVF